MLLKHFHSMLPGMLKCEKSIILPKLKLLVGQLIHPPSEYAVEGNEVSSIADYSTRASNLSTPQAEFYWPIITHMAAGQGFVMCWAELVGVNLRR
jgi:hypothetical protein